MWSAGQPQQAATGHKLRSRYALPPSLSFTRFTVLYRFSPDVTPSRSAAVAAPSATVSWNALTAKQKTVEMETRG